MQMVILNDCCVVFGAHRAFLAVLMNVVLDSFPVVLSPHIVISSVESIVTTVFMGQMHYVVSESLR